MQQPSISRSVSMDERGLESHAELGSSSTHLPVLDGLRFAVVLVMLSHFGNFGNPAPSAWIQRGFLLTAELAFVSLDIFFVLSGFLITRILLDSKGSESYFRTFYARRALRIIPVYYGFLIVWFVVLPGVVSWPPGDLHATPLQHFLYWTLSQNFWPIFEPFAGPIPETSFLHATGHLWSLAVEEQFYLLWPLIVHVCSVRTLKRVCLWLMLAAPLFRLLWVNVPGTDNAAAYVLTPGRMDGIALGALIALAARSAGGIEVYRRWARFVAPAMLVTLVILLRNKVVEGNAVLLTVGLAASVYFSGALVLLSLTATPRSRWHRLLASWPLRSVGRCSYAIYVVHGPLAFALERTGLVRKASFHEWIAAPLGAELAYSATLITMCICAGTISWHLYERPMLSLRRFV